MWVNIFLGFSFRGDVKEHTVAVKRVHEMGQIRDLDDDSSGDGGI